MAIGQGIGFEGWNFEPYVKRKDCGRFVKYCLQSHKPQAPRYQYLSEDWYINSAGYLAKFVRSESKGDNLDSVRRSFARLRDIINANIVHPENVLFVTYTYDPKRLSVPLTLKKVSKDMRNCFTRWRSSGHEFEYVYTIEQQGNGNWHQHCLMFFPSPAPYVPQEDLETYWKLGFVRISKRFDAGEQIEDVGAYVCADMTFGEAGDEHGREKVERLKSYPSGAHLYRCSRGIVRPEETEVRVSDYVHEANMLGQPVYHNDKVIKFGESPDSWRWFRYEHFKIY